MLARGLRRLRPGAGWVAAVCVVGLLGAVGVARSEGPGVRSSRLIFHPSLELGGSYDSNFFRDSAQELTGPPDPVWALGAAAGLKLANRSPTRLGISLSLDGAWRELWPVGDLEPVGRRGADHRARQIDARSGLEAIDGALKLAFGPRSSFSLGLEAEGRYTDEPANELLFDEAFRRLEIEAGPDLRFRPGDDPDSRALEMRLGYRFAALRYLDLVEPLGSAVAQKDTHKIRLHTRWNFYPKTAALFDVKLWIVNYPQGIQRTATDSLDSPDKDLTPLRISVGLKGLLTHRLSATLRAGFAHSFNSAGQSYQGLIADTALEYRLEPRLTLRLSYVRRLDDDSFANYYVIDRFALEGTLALPGRLELKGKFGVDLVDYAEGGRPAFVVLDRQETTLLADVELGWHATGWLAVVGRWKLEDNRSDFCYRLDLSRLPCPDPGSDAQIDRVEYTRHIVSVLLRLSY